MRGDGRIFKRASVWWVAYYAPKDGRSVERREPAIVDDHGTCRPARNPTEARRFLKKRRDEVGAHRIGARAFKGPDQERLSLHDLLSSLERDYETRRLASLPQLRSHLKHVRTFFDGYRALAVNADRVAEFIAQRRGEGASEATIQRELEAIRRAFALAAQEQRLAFTPVIPSLNIGDTNAREGFLSRGDFETLLANLGRDAGRGKDKHFEPDADLQDFVAFAWWTAMRKGEITKLTWEAFDREAWTLALHAKDAKTRKGRVLALEGPLRKVLEHRLQRRRLDVGLIFHRHGQPVAEFRKAWATACKRAGLSGVLFHDLRRSAIRNMVRAGVDSTVAMRISGHRTDRTFRRYNITAEDDIRNAMVKTADYVSTLPTDRKITPMVSGAGDGGAA